MSNYLYVYGLDDDDKLKQVKESMYSLSKLHWNVQRINNNIRYQVPIQLEDDCTFVGIIDYKGIHGQLKYLGKYNEISHGPTTVIAIGRRSFTNIASNQNLSVAQALYLKYPGFQYRWEKSIYDLGVDNDVQTMVESYVSHVHRLGSWMSSMVLFRDFQHLWPKAQAILLKNMAECMMTDAMEFMQSFILVLLGGTVHCVGITSCEYILA